MKDEQGMNVGAQGSGASGSVWKWYRERAKPSRGHGETRARRVRFFEVLGARIDRGYPAVFEGDPSLRSTKRRIRRAAFKWDHRREVARRLEPADNGRAAVRALMRVAFTFNGIVR
jgi:hypothetical protein